MSSPENKGIPAPFPPARPASPPQISFAEKDARFWAMLTHLIAFSFYVSGIGHIVGPLVVWALKKDSSAFVDANGKESMNFQISITIYSVAAVILCFTIVGAIIGIPLLIGLHVMQIVCIIIASIKAYDGVTWRYPLTIRIF